MDNQYMLNEQWRARWTQTTDFDYNKSPNSQTVSLYLTFHVPRGLK